MLLGHSLGGILIKQALVQAQANPSAKYRNLLNSTFALVFLGTPHNGPQKSAKLAVGKMCAHIAKTSGLGSDELMKVLETNSMFRNTLEESWKHQLERYKIVSCYEGLDSVELLGPIMSAC